MEESSESGSGHSNRLLGLRRFSGASNVVSRGQGPKQRFSWQRGDGVWRWLREEGADCVVSFLVSRVVSRFVLSFRKGKEKEALEG